MKILIRCPWFWSGVVMYGVAVLWVIKGFDIIDWYLGRV